MTFRPLSSTNSDRTNWGQLNDMIRDLNSKERIQIFKDDTGTRRVLLGKGADGFYGLKVSKEGQDVYTAPNDQLIFNSGQNTLKVVLTDTTTIPEDVSGPPYTSSVTVTHGLGFIPVVIAYAGTLGTSVALPFHSFDSSTGTLIQQITVGLINANTVGFTMTDLVNPIVDTGVRYYLMQETAAI